MKDVTTEMIPFASLRPCAFAFKSGTQRTKIAVYAGVDYNPTLRTQFPIKIDGCSHTFTKSPPITDTATTLPAAPPSTASTTPPVHQSTDTTRTRMYTPQAQASPPARTWTSTWSNQDWSDGNPIPQDVTGEVETVSVNNGDIVPVPIWHAPLAPGSYDIVIDANRNGVYNAATDGLDSGSPGFIVVADAPPSPPTDVPELTPPGIIALVGLLCVIAVSRIRRGFN